MSIQRDRFNMIRRDADPSPLPSGGAVALQVAAPGGGGGSAASGSLSVSISGAFTVGTAVVCINGTWQQANPSVAGHGIVGVVTAYDADTDTTTAQVSGSMTISGTPGDLWWAGLAGALTTTRPTDPDVGRLVGVQVNASTMLLPVWPLAMRFPSLQACVTEGGETTSQQMTVPEIADP